MNSFSVQNRQLALERFKKSSTTEPYDLLIIGGGITGVATARDAVMRGLRVALVEKNDFASGTSSKSSKLLHGGLRYLEQGEFHLVFEALNERSLLLKNSVTTARPLPFYFPVYSSDKRGMGLLSIGLFLYDLLTLFRTPGFHRRLSKKKMQSEIPSLYSEGLRGGFRYYDASMWDDLMVVEVIRDAIHQGVDAVHYCEAIQPIWNSDDFARTGRIIGYEVMPKDIAGNATQPIQVFAKQIIHCVGPWTDLMNRKMQPNAFPKLAPSRGLHLVFDLKRLNLPGALVMSTESDGRIAFVIPRPDLGAGVTIVGTTDGPSADPDLIGEARQLIQQDTEYLLGLLEKYFPSLQLTKKDIISHYIGIRPLAGPHNNGEGKTKSLQKVSREHTIEWGVGGVIWVYGGKYTTHRTMAEEIVDFSLQNESLFTLRARALGHPTKNSFFPEGLPRNVQMNKMRAEHRGFKIPEVLWQRAGSAAVMVYELDQEHSRKKNEDPDGFPLLEALLRYSIRHEGVYHLEDFVFRRVPLFLARKDHGMPWWFPLAEVWAEEMKRMDVSCNPELEWQRLKSRVKELESL